MLRTILEILTALFAVYGIYSAIRALAELCFVPRAYAVAVRFHPGEPVGELAGRIVEARLALCSASETRVLLLCDEMEAPDAETAAFLRETSCEVLSVKPYFSPHREI